MSRIATRCGRPAYEAARPRLRQSHFDTARRMGREIAANRAQEQRLAHDLGEKPEPGICVGTAWTLMGIACVAVWIALFAGLGII
ncbi:hypothetical protein [Novosphingobium colocasiae]|uniref:hypothetical protein n=1 Tax=Novosphingobium colocasiae TaxID=1256513 RepID=UPI0035B2EA0D